MTDREKVIKGLEVCTSKPCYCTNCPYKANCCLDSQEVMEDALSLLKEQEAIIDKLRNRHCPSCGTILKGRYCHECGQAIKLD